MAVSGLGWLAWAGQEPNLLDGNISLRTWEINTLLVFTDRVNARGLIFIFFPCHSSNADNEIWS